MLDGGGLGHFRCEGRVRVGLVEGGLRGDEREWRGWRKDLCDG